MAKTLTPSQAWASPIQVHAGFTVFLSLIAMDEMEDIEDMARDPVDNAPLGLHLPQHGRSNGTNGVAIKPRRRIAANFGAIREDLSSLSVTGTTEGGAKVPGTQVSLSRWSNFFF